MTKIYMVHGYSLETGEQDIIDYVEAASEAEACRKYESRNPGCEANEILMDADKDEFEVYVKAIKENSRDECERKLLALMREAVAIYHQYNPDGNYLTLTLVNGVISGNNSYFDNDRERPVNFWAKEDTEHDF